MKIFRNGTEFELTNEEIRLASYEYDNKCLKEDILSKGNDMKLDMPEEALDDIITMFNKALSNNENYWDAYWLTMEDVLEEFNEKKNRIIMNKKIWVSTVNTDDIEIEHEWNSVEELQRNWCSEDCTCPCGDDEVLGYSINSLVQDINNIKVNKYGYRDFSSLLKILGVKDNNK